MGTAGKEPKSLESSVRTRARRGTIERAILNALVLGGALTIAAVAPKVLSLIRDEHLDLVLPRDPKQRLRETAARLRRKGFVTFEERGGKKHLRITTKGKSHIEKLDLGAYAIGRPLRWDERWRVVIFDVPERQRAARMKLRGLLGQLGFYRLQDSVWVHPFDCEEIVALIKTHFRLGLGVRYLIADAIEFDQPLRKHFGLS